MPPLEQEVEEVRRRADERVEEHNRRLTAMQVQLDGSVSRAQVNTVDLHRFTYMVIRAVTLFKFFNCCHVFQVAEMERLFAETVERLSERVKQIEGNRPIRQRGFEDDNDEQYDEDYDDDFHAEDGYVAGGHGVRLDLGGRVRPGRINHQNILPQATPAPNPGKKGGLVKGGVPGAVGKTRGRY